ncbi:unnamed protein product [Allacma fusca]|uniref:Uncharacterized protein n=1 Tax=Allacma fusca TaxID=39272 RepID=A0A8J2JSB6_9HEXA|nr:unnamed protein product [Allacma fusca]
MNRMLPPFQVQECLAKEGFGVTSWARIVRNDAKAFAFAVHTGLIQLEPPMCDMCRLPMRLTTRRARVNSVSLGKQWVYPKVNGQNRCSKEISVTVGTWVEGERSSHTRHFEYTFSTTASGLGAGKFSASGGFLSGTCPAKDGLYGTKISSSRGGFGSDKSSSGGKGSGTISRGFVDLAVPVCLATTFSPSGGGNLVVSCRRTLGQTPPEQQSHHSSNRWDNISPHFPVNKENTFCEQRVSDTHSGQVKPMALPRNRNT